MLCACAELRPQSSDATTTKTLGKQYGIVDDMNFPTRATLIGAHALPAGSRQSRAITLVMRCPAFPNDGQNTPTLSVPMPVHHTSEHRQVMRCRVRCNKDARRRVAL
jgi:hypothetical protein